MLLNRPPASLLQPSQSWYCLRVTSISSICLRQASVVNATTRGVQSPIFSDYFDGRCVLFSILYRLFPLTSWCRQFALLSSSAYRAVWPHHCSCDVHLPVLWAPIIVLEIRVKRTRWRCCRKFCHTLIHGRFDNPARFRCLNGVISSCFFFRFTSVLPLFRPAAHV
jgi:hypothetical protein